MQGQLRRGVEFVRIDPQQQAAAAKALADAHQKERVLHDLPVFGKIGVAAKAFDDAARKAKEEAEASSRRNSELIRNLSTERLGLAKR